jgi:hypothetical protein
MTAYLDAIGKTINEVGDRLDKTPEEEKPSKVIFVITTDGLENASKEFKREQIKDMITHQTNIYNWQFIFLGANIDAVTEANSIGIFAACNYTADVIGTKSVYTSMSNTISNYRTAGEINKDWKDEIK